MLSRIADSLFWINRYMERTDGILRLVYIHYSLSLDKDVSRNLTWKPVLEMFTGMKEEEIEKLDDQPGLVLKKILIDTSNSNSLKVLVNRAALQRQFKIYVIIFSQNLIISRALPMWRQPSMKF